RRTLQRRAGADVGERLAHRGRERLVRAVDLLAAVVGQVLARVGELGDVVAGRADAGHRLVGLRVTTTTGDRREQYERDSKTRAHGPRFERRERAANGVDTPETVVRTRGRYGLSGIESPGARMRTSVALAWVATAAANASAGASVTRCTRVPTDRSVPQCTGTTTAGLISAVARAADSGFRCPAGSRGPQPQIGSSATSTRPSSAAISSNRSVSPAKYTRTGPSSRNPSAGMCLPSGWRRP